MGEILEFRPRHPRAHVVTKGQLARWRNCPRTVVEQHMDDGLPHFYDRGGRALFVFLRAFDWYRDRSRLATVYEFPGSGRGKEAPAG
jgi:hypothetical protein